MGALLSANGLLLLAQLGEFIFQLLESQFQRLVFAGHARFGGHHLAGNVLQTPRRIFADTGKALLGRDQLLLHQGNLLETPPAQTCQRDQ